MKLTQTQLHSGARVYTAEVAAFPTLNVNVHLLVRGASSAPSEVILFDTGSARPSCIAEVKSAFLQIKELYGEQISPDRLDLIVLSHTHADHSGGLSALRTAPVLAHPLAALQLTDPLGMAERGKAAATTTLLRLGVPESALKRELSALGRPSDAPQAPPEHELKSGDFAGLHVVSIPGHASDQIAVAFEEALFVADQGIFGTVPPLWPEWHKDGLGLKAYLASNLRLDSFAKDAAVILPGHGLPYRDWAAHRIAAERSLRSKAAAVQAQVQQHPGAPAWRWLEAQLEGLPLALRSLRIGQTAALLEYGLQTKQLTANEENGVWRWEAASDFATMNGR